MENAKHSYKAPLIHNFSFTKCNFSHIPRQYHFQDKATSGYLTEPLLLFGIYSLCLPVTPNPHEVDIAHAIPTLNCNNIDEQQVYEILLSLDTLKAVGIDIINPSVLRHCATPLAQPLCHLLRYCLFTCNIPSEWQIHCITPIFKSGDRSNVANYIYRPISLLCMHGFKKYWRD